MAIQPRFILAMLLGSLTAFPAASQTIENERFRATLGPGGALEVLDKPANALWRQPPLDVTINGAGIESGRIVFTVNRDFRATVALENDAIDLTLSAEPAISVDGLEYPAGFSLVESTREQRLLLPNCAGLAIPFSMMDDPLLEPALGLYEAYNRQQGLMMPWIGVDDGERAAYSLLLTPFDARMRVDKHGDGYQHRAVWLNSKGSMGYDRKVRFSFVGSGGAVALCKVYREHAKNEGLFVSLKEKAELAPQMDRFVGAISFWDADWPDIRLYQKMKADGLNKVLVSVHARQKIPEDAVNRSGHNTVYEAMDRSFIEQLHQLGFLGGRYDYYRTIFPPDDAGTGGNQWIFRQIGYPEDLAWDAEGKIIPGFRGDAGGGAVRGLRCWKCQYELALAYIPVDVDRTPYDARLLDAVVAGQLFECYNPAHPVTRSEEIQWRQKLLKVSMDYGLLTGTEAMAAWAAPFCAYAEAPTTFVRFFSYREGFDAQTFETPPAYRAVALNEKLRFPLWNLVFHDSVILTNRWTFTANKYADETIWDQEDLINLLHGHMPTMMIDRENYEEKADRILETYNTVCEWNGKVGYEEMTDFRWLTEDGSVQQSTYASGDSVTVNFGESDFRLPNGKTVPGRGYRTERK